MKKLSFFSHAHFYYNIFKYYCLKFVNAPYVYIPSLSFSQSEFLKETCYGYESFIFCTYSKYY